MRPVNRQQTAPIRTPRTKRNQAIAVMTSVPAGKCVPVVAIPMLREDALKARVRIAVEMQETKELLANRVVMRVTSYVVPWLAFERFEGSRDQFDRSYMKQAQVEGGNVVPFVETHAMGAHGSNAIYKALGLHGKPTDQVNTMYLEAVNAIWNFRAKNRSRHLTARGRLETTLPPAFWNDSRFEHVVPDFDQAVIDGEVALNVVQARMPVRGIGFVGTPQAAYVNAGSRETSSPPDRVNPASYDVISAQETLGANQTHIRIARDATKPAAYPDIYAELQENGITVSLANIAVARKAQWFAKLREKFEGHDEEWIIDMLMSGLSIPEQHLKQPILIADQTVPFAQVKRYATDAGNLAESAVSGGAAVEFDLRVPQLSVGGVVIVQVECMPQQLFERQRDPFFHSTTHDTWPEYLRDEMDPEKVDIVKNGEIDTDHSAPNATFGFAPMNWKWNSWGPRAGGKFYRPSANTSVDVERQRFWAVENIDPALTEDFYLVNDIHTKPFLDPDSDPFEAAVLGNAVLTGNTVFGGMLVEATNNYDKVMEQVPMDRINKGA